MNEQLITLIIALREAQKEFDETNTRSAMMEKIKFETRVDAWIQNHMANKIQLELWTRSIKSSETPGVYNIVNDDETEKGGGS